VDSLGPIIATQVEAAVITDAPNASAQANSGESFGAHLASSNAAFDVLAQVEKVTLEIEASRRVAQPVGEPTPTMPIDVAAIAAAITAAIAIGRPAAVDAEPVTNETHSFEQDAPALLIDAEVPIEVASQPLSPDSVVFEALYAELTASDAPRLDETDAELPSFEAAPNTAVTSGAALQSPLPEAMAPARAAPIETHIDPPDRVDFEGKAPAPQPLDDALANQEAREARPAIAHEPDLAQSSATFGSVSPFGPANPTVDAKTPVTSADRSPNQTKTPAEAIPSLQTISQQRTQLAVESVEQQHGDELKAADAKPKTADLDHAPTASSATSEKHVLVKETAAIAARGEASDRVIKIATPEQKIRPETRATNETAERRKPDEQISQTDDFALNPANTAESAQAIQASRANQPLEATINPIAPNRAPSDADEPQKPNRATQTNVTQNLPQFRANYAERTLSPPASGVMREAHRSDDAYGPRTDVVQNATNADHTLSRQTSSGEQNQLRSANSPLRGFTTLEPSRPIPSWQATTIDAPADQPLGSAEPEPLAKPTTLEDAALKTEEDSDDKTLTKIVSDARDIPTRKPEAQDKSALRPVESEAHETIEATDDARLVAETDSRRTLTEAQKLEAPTQQALRDPRMRQLSEDLRARALERQVIAAAREGVDQIRMQLYPPGLGQIILRVSLEGGKLKLQARTGNAEAADALRDIADALGEALNDSGFELMSFDVAQQDSEGEDRPRDEKKKPQNEKKASDFSIDVHV
jgi:flagellar hook-length control protein FliK